MANQEGASILEPIIQDFVP